jgi:peroxiredoxin
MPVLSKGDKAPDFKGVNQNGETISLADFSGKKLIYTFTPRIYAGMYCRIVQFERQLPAMD